MNRPTAEERAEFIRRITAINLERIWWMCLTCINLSAALFAGNSLFLEHNPVLGAESFDLLLTFGVLVLTWQARRKKLPLAWCRPFVVIVFILMLATMDFYFFAALPAFGHNSSYVLGVVVTGVLFLLPMEVFLAVVLLNHAIYCGILLTSGFGWAFVAPAIADGTGAVLIAALASRFLYMAKWSDFRKERVITLRSRQLAASNEELKRRNDEMNEMMAIAAHDLRSPLQGQRNLLELVRQRLAGSSDSILKALDSAILSCEDILSMVTRLLDAHAAEHRASRTGSGMGDLGSHLGAAVERAQASAQAKEMELICQTLPSGIEATFDPAALDLVLDNLLSNAVKFSPKGSRVCVSLVSHETGWSIEISDEGPGISEEEQASLFRKFHRGSNLPTSGEKSTGLGLFITKKLAESMGARIQYVKRHPVGSVFRVDFASSPSV